LAANSIGKVEGTVTRTSSAERSITVIESPKRVVVADDHPFYRDGLTRGLTQRGIEVVAEVGDGRAALEAIRRDAPDVALVDYEMPDVDGAGFLDRHHYTGRVSAQILAERMRAHLLSASPGTVAGKSFSAQSFTRLLQLLNSQLADYDDAIATAVAEHPDAPIFASFPGIGPVLTGVLLAEIGEDRARFPPRRFC
jgi:hypothetical protein